jgi:hypothetical protein
MHTKEYQSFDDGQEEKGKEKILSQDRIGRTGRSGGTSQPTRRGMRCDATSQAKRGKKQRLAISQSWSHPHALSESGRQRGYNYEALHFASAFAFLRW